MESPDNRQGSTFSWLMTPTAQHGGRILSEPTAQPGGFFAPAIERMANGLSDRVSRRRDRRGATPRRESRLGAAARHGLSIRNAVRERDRLVRDGTARRLLRVQGRCHAALAAVLHHRHSRRLHDVLRLLARRRAALPARRVWPYGALHTAVGRARDRRAVCGACACAQLLLNAVPAEPNRRKLRRSL